VYALGVGRGVREEALKRMCTGGQYFHVSDYQAFVREVKLAQDEASARAARFLSIDFLPASKNMTSDGPLDLKVIVFNNSADAQVPAGQRITFEKNNYFQPTEFILPESVPPKGHVETRVTLVPSAAANENDFPGEIEFVFQHGRTSQRGAVTLGTGESTLFPSTTTTSPLPPPHPHPPST